jgi:hypothetical protein
MLRTKTEDMGYTLRKKSDEFDDTNRILTITRKNVEKAA